MSFALAKQIVTVTVLHAVDAIGSMLSERFLGESGQYLRFNIDGRNFPGRPIIERRHSSRRFSPLKGASFHAKVRWPDGHEIGASTKAVLADIGLDRRMDQPEQEITLRQAVKRHRAR
jgi:hypothetical protein